MKIAQVIIAAAMLVGSFAQAEIGRRSYQSNLKNIHMDKKLMPELGNLDVDGGTVTVDFGRMEAVLTVYRRFYCPPEVNCALSMPAPIVIKLPIVRQHTDECGNKIVTATDAIPDLPFIAGTMRTLTVADHTKNRCPTFQMLPATSVLLDYVYTVTEPMVYRVQTYSTMDGDKLFRTNHQF